MLTTNANDPRLKEGQQNQVGQHDIYLVLSEEERAKGFVRPVRDRYIHVGRLLNYKRVWRMLDEEEKKKFPDRGYVALMVVLTNEDDTPRGGPYVTQEELEAWQNKKRIGGCGTETNMDRAIAETYARDPNFYGSTFCCHCNRHISVSEFVWSETNITVGT